MGIPEFLKGVGDGVEAHVVKLEAEIGDFQKLLATRTLRLKKLGIPCKHRGEAKLITEDWEGAVEDLKIAAQKSPQDMNIREALSRAEKSLRLSKRKDWYKILGVSKTASIAEIKRAYKKLALQWHPDKNVDNRETAEAQFREIAAAYEVLGDEEKRTRYDQGEDVDDIGMGMGGGGFNPFAGGGQQFTFSFEGGFPGGFEFNF